MKDDWVVYSFGDEKIGFGMDDVPGGYLYFNDEIEKFATTHYMFGESWNLDECREAIKKCRIFSFRINLGQRYEP